MLDLVALGAVLLSEQDDEWVLVAGDMRSEGLQRLNAMVSDYMARE